MCEPERPCRCEDCGLTYEETSYGAPATERSYTCDDCGGYVMDRDETIEADDGR